MAEYKVVDAEKLDADLSSVADAIRTKGGTSESLTFPQGFVDAVGAIESGGGGTEEIEKQFEMYYVLSKKLNFNNNNTFTGNNWAYNTIPKIDFGLMTSLLYAFAFSNIEYIDYYINSEKVTNFGSCFASTQTLKWIVGVDWTSATNISDCFNGCAIERIIEPLDFTKVTIKNKWNYAPNLSDFRIVPESYKLSGDFPYSFYTSETIQSIIDGLATVETAQTLTLHADVKAKLTQTQLATITNKNWNLA